MQPVSAFLCWRPPWDIVFSKAFVLGRLSPREHFVLSLFSVVRGPEGHEYAQYCALRERSKRRLTLCVERRYLGLGSTHLEWEDVKTNGADCRFLHPYSDLLPVSGQSSALQTATRQETSGCTKGKFYPSFSGGTLSCPQLSLFRAFARCQASRLLGLGGHPSAIRAPRAVGQRLMALSASM
jgi:hypothetical protein